MLGHSLFVKELKVPDMADNLEVTGQVHWHFVNNLKQPVSYHDVEYILS